MITKAVVEFHTTDLGIFRFDDQLLICFLDHQS